MLNVVSLGGGGVDQPIRRRPLDPSIAGPANRRVNPLGESKLAAGCAPDQREEVARLREQVAELRAVPGPPPSLDSLYPPFTEGPVYLQRMRALSAMLTGVGVDLAEQDVDNARSGFARFRDEYVAVAQLVPEWADDYPIEPVDGLGAVLESGSRTVVESFDGLLFHLSVDSPVRLSALRRCRSATMPRSPVARRRTSRTTPAGTAACA